MRGILIGLALAAAAVVLFVAVGGLESRTSLMLFTVAVVVGATLAFLARRRPRK